MTWLDIDGWLSPAEGQVLAVLAAGKSVLELGSYKGRSTVCMAALASDVTAVDTFRGDDGTGRGDTYAEFLVNLDAHGVRDRVDPVVARIEDLTPRPDRFDLAFIDAAHDAETTATATRLALRCLKPGGTIAWHDWNYPAVRAGVAACGLAPVSFRDSLAWTTVNP